jgi:dipeptidyl aminopeptidase/acylaminoacyl peptidase
MAWRARFDDLLTFEVAMRRLFLKSFGVAFLLCATLVGTTRFAGAQTADAAAQPPKTQVTSAAEIPVEAFFRRAEFSNMVLSPNGRKLAVIVPFKGRGNIGLIDLENRKSTLLTSFTDTDIYSFQWIDDNRIYFVTADSQAVLGDYVLRGRYAADIDGKNIRNLMRPTMRTNQSTGTATRINILSRTYDGTGEVIVEMNERNSRYNDVYRYNTKTAEYKLLTFDSPGNVQRWVADRNLVPRVAVRLEERVSPDKPRAQTIWHRAGEGKPWEKIHDSGVTSEFGGISPIAFDFDNETLYVSSNNNLDKRAIYKFDIANRKLGDLVLEHPLVDIGGGMLFSHERKKLLGITYSAEMPETVWLDPEMAKLQKSIDLALPSTRNELTSSLDSGGYMLIYAHSARDPGTYYIYNTTKATIEPVAKTRPWLPAALMPERRFVKYKARDGMEIPAWVTIPPGTDAAAAKKLPLIVHIHGGPWARAYHGISWGLEPIAQFFASRGYVVLEPEPRGSTGWGRKHYSSSFKQFGLAMQDDITDGALHLVNEGLVDKERMCLFGASYGGYATLQGLVKDPDLWRCASAYVAVTDLELWQTLQYSDTAQMTDFFDTDFKRRVGDREQDREQFRVTSPAKNAAKIKAPVMLTMGSDDRRVPLAHGDAMKRALNDAGKSLEYVVYQGEAHGFNKPENVFDFFRRNERFFAEHLKAPSASR